MCVCVCVCVCVDVYLCTVCTHALSIIVGQMIRAYVVTQYFGLSFLKRDQKYGYNMKMSIWYFGGV